MREREIEVQEKIDYNITKNILQDIFKGKLDNIEKLEQYSVIDCAFTASTINARKEYGIEIKETTRDLYKTEGFILKVSKYINILNWSSDTGHSPFIIYLCKLSKMYYIFDIRKIKLTGENMVNKMIKVTEFKDTQKAETPCLLLYTKDAIASGYYDGL